MINPAHVCKIVAAYTLQLANVILALCLPIAEYGHLVVLLSFSQLIFTMSSGITNGALINIGSRNFIIKKTCSDTVIYRYIIVGTVFITSSVTIMYFRKYIIAITGMQNAVEYILIMALGYIMFETATKLLYPTSLSKFQSYLELSIALIFSIYMLTKIRSIEDYIYGYGFISVIAACITIYVYSKNFYLNVKLTMQGFLEVFQFSAWQTVSVASIYLINYGSNYIMLFYKVPLQNIGTLNFGLRLFFGMSSFFSLIMFMMPRLVNSKNFKKEKFNIIILKIILGLCSIYVLSSVSLYIVLSFFKKTEYLKSILFMMFLFPAFIGMAYSNIVNTFLSNTKDYKQAQFVILGQATVLIVCSFVFIYFFHLYGILLAYTVAYMMCAYASYYLYNKSEAIPL